MDGLILPTKLDLPADLAAFAAEAVACGRYENTSAVVLAGLKLLRDAEAQRLAFIASLAESLAEGERDGFLTVDAVDAEAQAAIEATVKMRA